MSKLSSSSTGHLTKSKSSPAHLSNISGNVRGIKSPSTPAAARNVSVHSALVQFLKRGDDSYFKRIHEILCKEPLNNSLMVKWIQQYSECIHLLDGRAEPLIADSLRIPWQKGDENVKRQFRQFIFALVTAHNYHAYRIVKELVSCLVPGVYFIESKELEVDPFKLCKDSKLQYDITCQLIVDICCKVPMVSKEVVRLFTKARPYYKRLAYVHVTYAYNVLVMSQKLPAYERDFLQVIIEDMISIDIHCPKDDLLLLLDDDGDSTDEEDLFNMEIDGVHSVKKKQLTSMHPLDALACLMTRYIHCTLHGITDFSLLLSPSVKKSKLKCPVGSSSKSGEYTKGCACNKELQDKESAKRLYENLRHIFAEVVLNTKATSHIQYLIFYLLSIRPSLLIDFLEFLKGRYFGPYPLELRCTAISYTASLLCRASFVPFDDMHTCMKILSDWCFKYIQSLHRNQISEGHSHILFYYICQTLMYVFTFKHKEYTKGSTRLKLSKSLHLNDLIHSQLNPIRHCSINIVEPFAAIANHYQVVYCYSLLEDAKRVRLPEAPSDKEVYVPLKVYLQPYFPFDPCLLPSLKEYIKNHYNEFDGMPEHAISPLEEDRSRSSPKNSTLDSMSPDAFELSGMSLGSYGLS